MREADHHHPTFVRFYAPLVAVGEHLTLGRWRSEVLATATGRLLVVGLGPGRDLAHLPPAVTSVVAVEPDPAMRRRAAGRAGAVRRHGMPVSLVGADAAALPLAAASVDTVLCALVLCSVHDVPAALAEIRRVLRPDGRLLVLEHVRASEGSRLGAVQERVDPLWARLAGGCHLDRRTVAALGGAGFDVTTLHDRSFRAGVPLCVPHVVGVSRTAPPAPPAAGR